MRALNFPARLSLLPQSLLLCTALLAGLAPSTAMSQSFGDVFKVLRQVTSSDTLGAIRSVAETVQGKVAPGTKAANANGKVVLFRTPWCGYCKRAAAYMQEKSIPFVERDIEANPSDKAEYARLGGNGAVPFIVFGEKTLYGFSEGSFDTHYADYQRAAAAAPPVRSGDSTDEKSGGASLPQAGDALQGKIGGVKVFASPDKTGNKLMVLSRTDEVIFMGEERHGLYRVTTPKGEGWADKLLLKKL